VGSVPSKIIPFTYTKDDTAPEKDKKCEWCTMENW